MGDWGRPDWNDVPDFGRRHTLLRALRRLHTLRPGPVCIVETGTLRDASAGGRVGDGWSTVAWRWYCSQVGGRVYTVDLDAGNLDVCRQVTSPYAPFIEYVHSDSLDFLRGWVAQQRGEIHLLYHDSLDYLDHELSEDHHRAEAEAALPVLATPGLALFDDTSARENGSGSQSFSGKGARAVPFLLQHGFDLEWAEGGQVLLARDGSQRDRRSRNESQSEA
jgi:hypothetical protein